MKFRRLLDLMSLVLLAVVVTGPALAAESAVVRLLFGAPTPTPTQYILVAVPEKMGYFKEEGLTVKSINGGLTSRLQIVVAGEADVTNPDAADLASAVATGMPVKGFYLAAEHWQWHVGVRPDSSIRSGSDLKGKKIGVVSLTSIAVTYLEAMLKASGVNPADVTMIPIGRGYTAYQALVKNQVDAWVSWSSDFVSAEGAGAKLRFLENPSNFSRLPGMVLVARADYLEKNPDVAGRLGRAMHKGLIFSYFNPEAAVRMGWEYYPSMRPSPSDEAKQLAIDTQTLKKEALEELPGPNEESWTSWGGISDERWQRVLDYTRQSGKLKSDVKSAEAWDERPLKIMNDLNMKQFVDGVKKYPKR